MKIIAKIVSLFIFILMLSGCSIWRTSQLEPLPPREASFYEQEGDAFLNENRYDMAVESYSNALKKESKAIETRRKLAETYFKLGKNDLALDEFSKILKIDSNYIHAHNYRGFIYSNENKWNEAINEFETSLKIDPNNIYALGHLGLAYKMAGRLEDAKSVLLKAINLDPEMDDPESRNVHSYLGLLYKDQGNYEGALEEYNKTIKHFPTDTVAQNRIGEIYEAMGKYLDAYIAYKKTLKIDPANTYAIQRIDALQQSGIYYVEPVDIVKDDVQQIIANAPDASQYPNDGAVFLLNKLSYDVTNSGSIRYTVHWIIKILNDRGIAQYGELAFPFNATYQNIGVNMARTILPDGTEIEAEEDAFHDITMPGLADYNLYSDVMLKIVNIPALEPGAIIEYKATVEDALDGSEKSWLWGGMIFQGDEPIINAKCVLRIPKDVNINWKPNNCDIEPVITEDDENLTYIWIKKDIPPIDIENAMPSIEDIIPSIYFSSSQSWDEVYNWYKDLADPQEKVDGIHLFDIGVDFQDELNSGIISESLFRTFDTNKIKLSQDARLLTEEDTKWSIIDGKKIYSIEMSENVLSVSDAIIAQKVRDLTADKETEEDKIKAIYEFVAFNIRYVAIELGQSAYQPNTPAEVLTYRYGDCKDKSTLLVAMLKHIGIKSYQALISPSPGMSVNLALPSIAQFSHVIVAIPKENDEYVWLDATASTCKYGDLPSGDQGRKAFIIGDDNGQFVDTPIYPAEVNKIVSLSEYSIQDDGTIEGWEKTIANGQADMYLKMIYRLTSPNKYKQIMESSLNQNYPGIKVNGITMSDLYNLDKPIEIKVDFSCPNYGLNFGDVMVFPIPSEDFSSYAILVGGDNTRKYDFQLGYNMMIERELTLTIPDNYTVRSLPDDITANYDFGAFTRKYEKIDDRTVRYSLSFIIGNHIIKPLEYEGMKKLIETVSKEDRAHIILKKNP
ncbi:TPA: tetratricopeptide repeat protein [bacterium]|mgnify:CR=1 FL=1|nr:tetratricopeptide repeat protein [bacterium]